MGAAHYYPTAPPGMDTLLRWMRLSPRCPLFGQGALIAPSIARIAPSVRRAISRLVDAGITTADAAVTCRRVWSEAFSSKPTGAMCLPSSACCIDEIVVQIAAFKVMHYPLDEKHLQAVGLRIAELSSPDPFEWVRLVSSLADT